MRSSCPGWRTQGRVRFSHQSHQPISPTQGPGEPGQAQPLPSGRKQKAHPPATGRQGQEQRSRCPVDTGNSGSGVGSFTEEGLAWGPAALVIVGHSKATPGQGELQEIPSRHATAALGCWPQGSGGLETRAKRAGKGQNDDSPPEESGLGPASRRV